MDSRRQNPGLRRSYTEPCDHVQRLAGGGHVLCHGAERSVCAERVCVMQAHSRFRARACGLRRTSLWSHRPGGLTLTDILRMALIKQGRHRHTGYCKGEVKAHADLVSHLQMPVLLSSNKFQNFN